jgi:hypothetical protein
MTTTIILFLAGLIILRAAQSPALAPARLFIAVFVPVTFIALIVAAIRSKRSKKGR